MNNREGMKELIREALASGQVKPEELGVFKKVARRLCAMAKKGDSKALKALETLKEAGVLSPEEYKAKVASISGGVSQDVVKATMWLRSGLHLTAQESVTATQEWVRATKEKEKEKEKDKDKEKEATKDKNTKGEKAKAA